MSTIVLTVAYFFNIIDYLFTTHWVNKFGIEIEFNPFGRWLYENNIAWVFKIVIIGILLFILYKFCDRYKLARICSYIVLAVYSLLFVSDIYGKLYRCVQEWDGYIWKSVTTPEPIVSYRAMNHHLLVPPTRNIPTVNYILGE